MSFKTHLIEFATDVENAGLVSNRSDNIFVEVPCDFQICKPSFEATILLRERLRNELLEVAIAGSRVAQSCLFQSVTA